MSTHTVLNQVPARVELDEYATNQALHDAVHRYDAGWAEDDLRAVGTLVGGAQFQDDARRANRNKPILRTHDRWGIASTRSSMTRPTTV